MNDLLRKLKKAYGQTPMAFKRDPVEALREHCWIAPYYEDDMDELRDSIGAGQMLFGSDFPHAEGLAEPLSFTDEIQNFSEDEIRKVMRDNALRLTQPL